ncbi:GntR family transcriptional regulator [Deinococcus aquiradiocola]|uniref:GntR family transcriptional regulator n=2 Tax=Deinococcus aquiradiocola TaxID=393059 RepID=A0A917PBX2_9DEIO|nr:GntR family transcriptional regulator [Deinococcus aquiradiocola]
MTRGAANPGATLNGMADGPQFTVTLDHAATTPIYLQVAHGIQRWLGTEHATPGTALPSERDLAGQFGVSRVTVRQAIALLTTQGLLERRRGSGTFILPRRIEHPLGTLQSFSDDMRARGQVPGAHVLSFALNRATPHEAMTLGLREHSRVYRIRRLRTADGTPLAVESSVLPEDRVGDLHADTLKDRSLYELLSARALVPVRALRHLRAVNADTEHAALLQVRPGAALLMTERVSWLADGTPIELASAHYRGDRYDFLMELTTPET